MLQIVSAVNDTQHARRSLPLEGKSTERGFLPTKIVMEQELGEQILVR